MTSSAGLCEGEPRCTTRRHDTHITEPRELRYTWHPWHGRQVWIRRFSARGGCPVFQCSLEPSCGKRWLEIPQWMFDQAVVCRIRLVSFPIASWEALSELRELITGSSRAGRNDVIRPEHQSPFRIGGSDATRNTVTAGQPIAALLSTDYNTSVGDSSGRGSMPDIDATRAMAADPHQGRTRRKPGGAR